MKMYRGIGNNIGSKSEMICGTFWASSIEVAKFFGDTIIEEDFIPTNPFLMDYEGNAKLGNCSWLEEVCSDDAILDYDCVILKNVVEAVEKNGVTCDIVADSILIF